jgi:hypothetical protein
MRRRELILFLGGAAAMLPLTSFAQKAPILIGFLGNQAAPPKGDAQGNAIIQGFIDNGLALQLPFCFEVRAPSDRLVSSAPE